MCFSQSGRLSAQAADTMRSIKCVVIGDGAVGKTSLLISYTTNSFPQDYIPTVFDNYSTTIAVQDPASSTGEQQLFKLNLWDTAGQEEYDRLRPLSYPQTDIFLICFSINEPVSFQNIRDKWFPEIKHNTNYENMELFLECGKYPILLVGTKADLRDDDHEEDRLREMNTDFVSQAEIERVVQDCGFMGYVECSAATQEGVREVFERAVKYVVYEPDRLMNRSKNMSILVNSPLPLDSYANEDASNPKNKGGDPSAGSGPLKKAVGDDGAHGKELRVSADKLKKKRRKRSRCTIL
ncbi:ABL139Cp [Eremothecium gossypii ATCC 10895]|uniref:ABL139Cp n=1 Tax=Eremothecium gossypii (strain ATCC 10895 / CBS 109.51 / FGSC 9923 / NRRL Y-1056) TaxID=284811 RepID=Q75E12_EREGS|nr:ABL139Cp [Eremothecium gossypii ATCC 10895]AAS50632.1 ABL139Cp [Eremothecium gossypii ATCC 10895]AEY94920.1 FABL139Cp [Eremothecium gossypii FDAG1]